MAPKIQRLYKLTWLKRAEQYPSYSSKMVHITQHPGALTKSIEDWRNRCQAYADFKGVPLEEVFEYTYECADVEWQDYTPPVKGDMK